MEFDKLAIQCKKLAFAGKEYEEIVQAIPLNTLSDQERKTLLSLLDDFIVQYNLAAQVKNKYLTQLMLGAVALLLGLFILIFTWIRKESSYGIGLAVTLIGLYIVKKSYTKYKQPIDFQHIAPQKESMFHRY